MPDIKNPLSDSDKEQLRARLGDINDARELLRRMKNAGLDVGDREKQLEDLNQQMLKLKQAFDVG